MNRTSRHSAAWSPTRKAADYLFRPTIPGKHHNLDSSLASLMLSRVVAK